VAVLRHRLYDIDPIIHRSIMWFGMTAVVISLHVVTVTLFAAVAGRAGLPAALAGTGVAAVAFSPVRDRLQRAVNRLLYGRRDEPYEVLTRLARSLSRPRGPEAALDGLAGTLAEALKLPHVAVELPAGTAGFRTAASVGVPVGLPLYLPLLHSGEVVGRLVVSPRSAGEPLSPRDLRLIDDVTRQAGPAVSAVRLTADLQLSRERLVTAREEERRRLRRDLHDGIGPLLAGQVLQLGAARGQVPPSAPALDRLLDRLGGQAQEALADLRRLVYGLRPPALDDVGLLGALREAAGRLGAGGGPSMRVVATTLVPALPAAVEVAVYRIAVEAMTNCVRHAGGRACEVRLAVGRDVLLEVRDDGAGLPSGYRAGVGVSGMRERADELGGSLVLAPAPGGGTLVTARLPLAAEPGSATPATVAELVQVAS
jgi:signal transduction histidine kinase